MLSLTAFAGVMIKASLRRWAEIKDVRYTRTISGRFFLNAKQREELGEMQDLGSCDRRNSE